MKKYVKIMIAVAIASIICMIFCAWLRDKFLIGLGIFTVLLCGYILCRAVQFAESEADYIRDLRRKSQEETSLKIQRELFWWEFITNERSKSR